MHIGDDDKLVLSNKEHTSDKTEERIAIRLQFMQRSYPVDILTEFLEMAKDAKYLKEGKNTKLKEIISNTIDRHMTLEEMIEHNLLDESRKKAIRIINEFK